MRLHSNALAALVPAIVAALSAPVGAAPQATPPATPTPARGVVTKVDVTVLSLDVMFVDGKGNAVLDVKPEEIAVRVAGKPQNLEFFEPPPGAPTFSGKTAGLAAGSAGGREERRILLWVDLEGMSMSERKTTLESIAKALAGTSGTKVWLSSWFGGPSMVLREESSRERVDAEIARLAEWVSPGENTEASVRSRGYSGGSASSPLSWELRRKKEDEIVRNLTVEACERLPMGGGRGPVQALAQQDLQDYLRAERERVRNQIDGLRDMAARFALLGGSRHVIFVGEGIERAPGERVVESARLTRLSCAKGIAGLPPLGESLQKPSPDLSVSPAPGATELRDFLSASGIFFHVATVGFGRMSGTASDNLAVVHALGVEQQNLEDVPARLVDATGGTFLGRNLAGLPGLLSAAASTYHVGVRVKDVQVDKPYSVTVAVSRPGVRARAQKTFVPKAAPLRLAEDAVRADEGLSVAKREARRSGASGALLPVRVTLRDASRPDPKDPARRLVRVEVALQHDELKFEPAEDGWVAGVKMVLTAFGRHPVPEATAELSPSFTSAEFKEGRDTDLVKTFTVSLEPGTWAFKVVVSDLLQDRFGEGKLEADVPK